MPEPLSAAPAWLREELVTMAWCWRLARRDGVVIGLTSHDRDLVVGGLVYRAAPGMKPSAIETSDGLDAATMDLEGAISSEAIAMDDLDAGRWDGAELELFVTDWSAADTAPVTVARGSLGAIERRGAAFAAELQGVTRALDRPACPATSPGCRAILGDRACRIDLAPLTHRRRVVAVAGRAVTLDAPVAGAVAGAMIFGDLLWIEGANCGLESPVISAEGAVLHLAEAPPLTAVLPVRVRLTEGCDKQLSTCRSRFANSVNFRGEAHLPGNDLLTRYPGG
ncbi:putative phage protein (TIGR02218 family) [Sphingopyxis panaciterrae]|nr:putative phage protein (TIGR02218 family) [Sphingopyxis panaciterrae]